MEEEEVYYAGRFATVIKLGIMPPASGDIVVDVVLSAPFDTNVVVSYWNAKCLGNNDSLRELSILFHK